MRSFTDYFFEAEWPGGYGEGLTHDPIPNSTVKTLSADGTAS